VNKPDLIAKIVYLMGKARESGNEELTPTLHCLNVLQSAAKMGMEEPLAACMANFVKLCDHIEPFAVETAKRQLSGEVTAVDPISGRELEQTKSGLLLMK
jgi:hypothetical protein